jgi:cytochrome c
LSKIDQRFGDRKRMLVLSGWPASFMDRVMLRIIPRVVIAFGALVASVPCTAAPNVLAGKAYAQANCARCHSIDKITPSSLAIAPPFRTLHERYPVESLEEALGEGITTGHASMPEFKLDPGQVGDFISFLKSLEQ